MSNLAKISKQIEKHAAKNIGKWGLQDYDTLILVATEELGETAKEVIAYRYSQGEIEDARIRKRIWEEARDFAAVGLQIMALVERQADNG